jgi:hypothetical protein
LPTACWLPVRPNGNSALPFQDSFEQNTPLLVAEEEGNTIKWISKQLQSERSGSTRSTTAVRSQNLLPSQLAISFSTDREGNIAMLSAPLEPLVKDIVFIRIPAGDCMDPAFRKDCIGSFSQGLVTIVVGARQ